MASAGAFADTVSIEVIVRLLGEPGSQLARLMEARRSSLEIKQSQFNKGVLAKYAKLVASASEGAITR